MSRFLSLVWFKIYPAHFGGQKGIAGFNKYLSVLYPVDCLCSSDNTVESTAGATVLPVMPAGKFQFLNPLVWNKVRKFFVKGRYTHVIVEYPYYGIVGFLLKKHGAAFILHTHNIESTRFRELGKRWWRLLMLYEKWSMNRADLILFKTKEDQQFAQTEYKIQTDKCLVLPYGVEIKERTGRQESRDFLESTYGIKPNERILLFSGTLDYAPNAEAVVAIYRELVPLLTQTMTVPYKILITGRNIFPEFQSLKEFKSPHIIQTGFVENIEPYFKGADLFINPVLNTHGIQTKVLDALSYNCNAVIFSASNVELPSYLLNRKIFAAKNKDYSDFAAKITHALVAEYPTPERFFRDYGWESLVNQFIHHLSKKGLL